MVPGREAGDVADVADHGGSDDRSDPEHLGQRRLGGGDRRGDPSAGLAALDIEADQVGDELAGELVSGRRDGTLWFDVCEQIGGLSWADLTGDAASDEVAQHGVQPAGDPGVLAGEVAVTLGPHLHHRRVILGLHHTQISAAQRGDGH